MNEFLVARDTVLLFAGQIKSLLGVCFDGDFTIDLISQCLCINPRVRV
jgi:hypothetical protein